MRIMKMFSKVATVAVLFLFLVTFLLAQRCSAQDKLSQDQGKEDPWKGVSEALGRVGRVQPDGAYAIGIPRDLTVTIGETKLEPALWMASAVQFSAPADNAMMMGDLVLLEDEVAPMLLKLQESDFTVTALHNHLTRENPRLLFMHIEGFGNALKLAHELKEVLAILKIAPPEIHQLDPKMDTSSIEQAVGHKGKIGGGALNISVPRREAVRHQDMRIPDSMGTSSILHFQPTGAGNVVITGDLVLIGTEVGPVVRLLSANGIEITAIHSHMLDEEPRCFFVHYWGTGSGSKLSEALGKALRLTNSAQETRKAAERSILNGDHPPPFDQTLFK